MRAPRPWHFLVLVVPFGVSFGWVGVALPYVARQKGIPVEAISSIQAAAFLPHALKVLWAPVVDATLTRKAWYGIALALLAAGTFAMVAMPITPGSLGALGAVVVASQVGLTLLYMACEGTLGRAVPAERKSTAASWLQAGTFLGMGVGGGLAIELVTHLSGQLSGAIIALGMCLCALPLLAFDEPLDGGTHSRAGAARELLRDVWSLIRSRAGVVAIFFAVSTVGAGVASNLFSALADDWHVSRALVETTNGWLAGIVQASGAGLGGWAMKRLDRRAAYMIAGGMSATMGIAMALGPRDWWAYVGFTLVYNLFAGAAYAAFSAFVYATIGKSAVATKYNILACIMNGAISGKYALVGRASRRWGGTGVLLSDATITYSGIVMLLIVIAISARLAPSEPASFPAAPRGRRRPPARQSGASRGRRRAASPGARTP
ncbi:MAG TPA: MFS transporter [Polyangiaceae bacterium]